MLEYTSPKTGLPLQRKSEQLISSDGETFSIIKNIPRFVPQENYASAFGLQWKTFAKTQLDSANKHNLSLERLERCLGFSIEGLKNKNVLEAGCGAGRFTELLVASGANVHSFDLSTAVETNKENIGAKENFRIAQASIYEIPYADELFDVVICLGVIQHTPSPEKTIAALWKKVKPGGLLVIDHYHWRLAYYGNLRFVYREILKRMKPERSQKIVNGCVKFFFPVHWALRKNKFIMWLLIRFSPLLEYNSVYPQFTKEEHYQWCLLDTYDSLTDYYKHLRTPKQIQSVLENLHGKNIWVSRGGNGVEARAVE